MSHRPNRPPVAPDGMRMLTLKLLCVPCGRRAFTVQTFVPIDFPAIVEPTPPIEASQCPLCAPPPECVSVSMRAMPCGSWRA